MTFTVHKNFTHITLQKMLLDCDQSNVLLACISFFCILLKAFFVPFGLYYRPGV